MGSVGRTGLSKFLLGRVTEKVVRNSKVPVMIVY
ncbi:MAG TPA: universal stress protein [Methanothrix sp.]|nr:universal stress protein [Methanothrix sp.]